MNKLALMTFAICVLSGCCLDGSSQTGIQYKELPGKTLEEALEIIGADLDITFIDDRTGTPTGLFVVIAPNTLLELTIKIDPNKSALKPEGPLLEMEGVRNAILTKISVDYHLSDKFKEEQE